MSLSRQELEEVAESLIEMRNSIADWPAMTGELVKGFGLMARSLHRKNAADVKQQLQRMVAQFAEWNEQSFEVGIRHLSGATGTLLEYVKSELQSADFNE